MNRIEKKFKELRKTNQKAFIAFITCGYPNLTTTEKLILEFAKKGVDIIELGVPFSDPMADGPIIQEASQVALEHKVNLGKILQLVKGVRRQTEIPICLMSYYNPIFCFGEERFTHLAHLCGVDGIILPDFPPEEAGPLIKLTKSHNLDIIFFISPTTSKERIRYIANMSQGFIYYVSLTGVTGVRKGLSDDLIGHLKLVKKLTDKPVCVGFGISGPRQVDEIYKIADGVIVGSAIIKNIKENLDKKNLVEIAGRFIAYLKDV